jgi:hypothetical protein
MNRPRLLSRVVLLCGVVYVQHAFAGAADYVYTPAVEYGEREIDFKFGATSPVAGNSMQGASIGYGYGAKEYWFTEVYLKQERSGSGPGQLSNHETGRILKPDSGERIACRAGQRHGGIGKRG